MTSIKRKIRFQVASYLHEHDGPYDTSDIAKLPRRRLPPPRRIQGPQSARKTPCTARPQLSGYLDFLVGSSRLGRRAPLRSLLPSILGCTLWSRHREDHIKRSVASFDSAIVENNSETTNARHRKDLDWLKLETGRIRIVEKDPEKVLIVITHYVPCITRISKPNRDGVGQYWSWAQVGILGGEGMNGRGVGNVWVFGHTHWSANFVQDEVRVYSNQKGRR
jgi:hypothetical protein